MSMLKTAIMSHKCKVVPLNSPSGEGWGIYNMPDQMKTASVAEKEDLGGFDIKQATKEHPDHLFLKIFAIKKDEPNDNGDSFSEDELKKAVGTFVGVPLFTNHQNDDIEKAKGDCVHSWYDDKEGGIYIIGRVDKIAYPQLSRGIESGYVSGCFPPDAPVLMKDGTEKNICDIEDGDEVISGKGNIKKVLGIRQRGYNYPLYSLKIEGIRQPIVCTAHHNLMVYRVPSVCACGCETELKERKDKRITNKNFNRKFFAYHGKNGISNNFNHEYVQKIKACDLKEGDFLIEPKFLDESCNNFVSEKEAFLIGLFLAEGNFENRSGSKNSIVFSFAHTELETLNSVCEGLLSEAFADYRNKPTVQFYPEASSSRVSLYGKEIARWFYERCGEYSDRKFLKEDLLKLGIEKTASLLAGYIEGDGYIVKGKRYGVATVSPKLASQLRLLFDKIGVRTQYRIRTDTKRYGYKPVHEITFGITTMPSVLRDRLIYKKGNIGKVNAASWHSLEDYTLRRVRNITEVAYDGVVYDIEVEDDHTYCVNHIAVSNTSMGASVTYSLCSVCHNLAHSSTEYCSHISNSKNRKYSGDIKCSYHKNGTEDKCPICGSSKGDSKNLKHADQMVFEHNYGLKFIENSFVVNPACHDCGVKCILNVPYLETKVASTNDAINNIIKRSYLEDSALEDLSKFGGVKELESLKNSMVEMETVVKSMLKQKENVSMEYVSDIVKAMSDIQVIFDELVEMGYGGLPSPAILDGEITSPAGKIPMSTVPQPQPNRSFQNSNSGSNPVGSIETKDLGGLGNVTLPKKSSKNKEDFLNLNQNLFNKVASLENNIKSLNENIKYQLETGAKMAIENENIKIAKSEGDPVITEKQLSEKTDSIHARKEKTYEGITESKEQLGGKEVNNDTTSNSPQVRQGTYETITEDQLKNALGKAIVHFDEFPEVITEKQWTDFSREAASDISKDYISQITEAQIKDLLSKHKFVGPVETITEDQLKNISMTDGLKRWANKNYSVTLLKVATSVVADMISKYNKTPDEIKKIASILSDNSEIRTKAAFLAVVNSIPVKKDERMAISSKAMYFSKKASKDVVSAMDSLILASSEHGVTGVLAEDVFDFVGHVVNNENAMKKVDSIINAYSEVKDKIVTKAEAFNSAMKQLDKPEDGLYRIKATMEDIGVSMNNKAAFLGKVKKFAQEVIDDDSVVSAVISIKTTGDGGLIIDVKDGGTEDEMSVDDIDGVIEDSIENVDNVLDDAVGEEVEEETSTDEIINEDATDEMEVDDKEGEEVEIEDEACEDDECDDEEEENKFNDCSANKKGKVKTAQMMGGEMGGMGGAAQGPGAGATMPAPAAAPGDPVGSFGEDMGGEGEDGGDMGDNLDPLPPGSICPVCGSDDVDILDGKGKCNNCSSEMTYKVEINVTKWKGLTPDDGGSDDEEDGSFEGEGFEMPDAGLEAGVGQPTSEEIPAAASVKNFKVNKFASMVRMTKDAVAKAVSSGVKAIGEISPATGSKNTMKMEDGSYVCLDTGTRYNVSFATSKDGKQVFGQWEWTPKSAQYVCPSCERAKNGFVKALASINISEDGFNNLPLEDQVKTIVELKKAGALNTIKTASKNGSVLKDYKLAFGGYGKQFPIESCIEKLARRFGQDALCLSGPDEGKPLAMSVCNRLKKADVYTEKLAIKVAGIWGDCDGDEECVTHQIRSGYNIRQAAEICSTLKVAVAEDEDFLADEISKDEPLDTMNDIDSTTPEAPITDVVDENVDPFEEGETTSVTLNLPIEIVEKLDAELDKALGENPADEEHHDDLNDNGVADIVDEATEGTDETDISAPIDGIDEIAPEGIVETDGTEEIDTKPVTPGEVEFQEDIMGEDTECCEDISEDGGPKVEIRMNGTKLSEQIMDRSIGKVGKMNMDLSHVINVLNKKASDKEISQENAQDSSGIGKYTDEEGSKMGHEKDTIPTAKKPDVPRGDALMGQEPKDLNPKDKPQPKIPSGDATMGHEKEVGLEGGDHRYTGGADGQGKASTASSDESLYHMKGFSSSKMGLSGLADRIAKKLEPKAPVSEDPDIKPISDGKTIGKEEKFDAKSPEKTEGNATESLIGHEKETLGDAPKSPTDHPDVFTGNAQMGGEELKSEKTTKDKGTVIAMNDSESEAIRVAGMMFKANKIEANELSAKVMELRTYKPSQIRDIEKSIFASEKGLNTVLDGKFSQAVQINENSSIRNANEDLSGKLTTLFTLGRQNKIADDDNLTQVRKTYKK